MQAFGADVMLAEMVTPCTALLAHKLDLSWVNHWPLAPFEPEFTSLWSASNRRMFQPNPLSYYPQTRVRTMTQSMVSLRPKGTDSLLYVCEGVHWRACADEGDSSCTAPAPAACSGCRGFWIGDDVYANQPLRSRALLQAFWKRWENNVAYWRYAWEDYWVNAGAVQSL